jgi:hypothetical protein
MSVEQTRSDELQLRSDELQRLLRTAALTIDASGSLRMLAERADIGYDGMMLAVRRGFFTTGMAAALEIEFGPELLPRSKLCAPKTQTN